MSQVRVNNITNRTGIAGPTVAGIPQVSSSSHFVVPTGRTGQRYADDGENIVRDGLVLYLDAKYSYPSKTGIGTTTSGAAAPAGSSTDVDVNTWYDMSGYENNGELIGGVGYNATNGGSLVFDGVDDYVLMGPNLQPQNITLSSWFSTNSLIIGALVRWRYYGYELKIASSGIINGNVWIDTSSNPSVATSNNYISTGQIYNAVFTFGNKKLNLYLNGSLVATNETYGNSIYYSSDGVGLAIGRDGGTSSNYLNGKIYQSLIYNRALTSAEVLQNYNALKGRFGL